jgi:hypothetical protein
MNFGSFEPSGRALSIARLSAWFETWAGRKGPTLSVSQSLMTLMRSHQKSWAATSPPRGLSSGLDRPHQAWGWLRSTQMRHVACLQCENLDFEISKFIWYDFMFFIWVYVSSTCSSMNTQDIDMILGALERARLARHTPTFTAQKLRLWGHELNSLRVLENIFSL